MNRVLGLVPAVLAAGAVVSLASRHAGAPARLAQLAPAPPIDTSPARVDLLSRLGAPVRRRFGGADEPSADRTVGLVLVIGIALLVVTPPLGALWGLVVVGSSVWRRRRAVQRAARALVDELPEVVDLLWLATAAGLTVPLAVAVVERHGAGRFAAELGRARRRSDLGPGLAAALDDIPVRLGEPVRPVTRVLASALRDGTSIAEALERVSAEVRTTRRRAAEERARRVSIRLLFPLVFCVLPAFALLTVVPLLAGALRGLTL